MPKYPLITVHDKVISKKRRYKVIKYPSGRYGIALDIKKAVLQGIIKEIQRCWGESVIETPVQVKFTFYVQSYPPTADVDHDNAKQLYLDLLQADKWKVRRMGKGKGQEYLASEGAGVIRDDSLVHSTDGTRFIFLCYRCKWGITGRRRSPIVKGEKTGCPGVTKCKQQRIEIQITDMVLNREGWYETV